jgi:hypothetical protein
MEPSGEHRPPATTELLGDGVAGDDDAAIDGTAGGALDETGGGMEVEETKWGNEYPEAATMRPPTHVVPAATEPKSTQAPWLHIINELPLL